MPPNPKLANQWNTMMEFRYMTDRMTGVGRSWL